MRGNGVLIHSIVFAIVLVSIIAIIPQAAAQTQPSLKFDQQKIMIEHKDVITLFDSNPTSSKIVTITSKNAAGVQIDTESVTLLESEPNVYRNMVKFTVSATSNPLEIRVEAGGSVTATRGTEIDNADIITETSGQVWGVRRYDNNWSNCSGPQDVDDDGVCDSWETFAQADLRINYPAGATTYDVDCNSFLDNADGVTCAGSDKRDIYVEIDYMLGHRPNEEALKQVINAFVDAPSQGSLPPGIRLHIQLDDSDANQANPILHTACSKFPGLPFAGQQGFDQYKGKYFGTVAERAQTGWDTLGWKQKKQVFHYVLFVHSQCGSTGSGTAEIFGNDMMITLGPFDGQIGSPDQQAGTFMHELGHNINLNHGGPWNDSKNCKPNHLSVMGYSRQFSDLVNDRSLDYSHQVLGNTDGTMLRESQPNELAGIEDYTFNPGERITWGPTPPMNPPPTTATCINWDLDGNECETNLTNLDLNRITNGGVSICTSGVIEDLTGNDDWSNVDLNSKGSGNWADGRSAEAGAEVAVWDGVDVKPSNMIPSFFCPPPEQILSVMSSGNTIEENRTHLDNYRNCAGGVGETDELNICATYVRAVQIAINSTAKDHFKNPSKIVELTNSLFEIEGICKTGQFNKVASALNLLLPKFDEEITDKTSLEHIKKAVENLHNIDEFETIDSSNEITVEDVRIMRLSRIDSIDKFLDNLSDNDFKEEDKTAFQDKINPKLDSVREDIKNDNMVSAVATLSNLTFDEITNDAKKQELETGIKDIYTSYSISYAVPEFGNMATLILVASIISIIVLATKTRNNLIRNISNKN